MQNRYTGDIGDIGKCALLRALAGDDLRVGLHWYLNADEEANGDGQFTAYPQLRDCDPALYDALHAIVESRDRRVAAIENGSILPRDTAFYSTPLTMRDLPTWDRASLVLRRTRWNTCAAEALAGADLVFMDPDTGFACKSATPSSKAGAKYVFPEELRPYLQRRQSLVIYQHQGRPKGGLIPDIARKCDTLHALGAPRVWSFVFRRQSVRVYFVVPAPAHEAILAERSRAFIQSMWGRRGHFELHGL